MNIAYNAAGCDYLLGCERIPLCTLNSEHRVQRRGTRLFLRMRARAALYARNVARKTECGAKQLANRGALRNLCETDAFP
jgi:hypothetical protein